MFPSIYLFLVCDLLLIAGFIALNVAFRLQSETLYFLGSVLGILGIFGAAGLAVYHFRLRRAITRGY